LNYESNHVTDSDIYQRNSDTDMIMRESTRPSGQRTVDTVDFGGGRPPRPWPVVEDIKAYLAHMDDACPTITSDPLEAEEIKARYIIGEEVGSGAIGQVIRAHDQHLGRDIAIKILHGGPGVSRDRLARFIAEAQITAQLEHPCVVPVHEIGRMPGGMPYFTMKLVKGESLEDVINNLRVGDKDYERRYYGKHVVRIFYRLAQGVAYAHDKGVIHRDLKPANIMIGRYGEVQIMDWGLAKLMREGDSGTAGAVQTVRDAPDLGTLDGDLAGTPAYMSPEQAHADTAKIGPQSDVFSLGLILAELLTLVRVFRNECLEETLEQVRKSGGVDIYSLKADVKAPPELAAIVRKCTDPDPDKRYRDAGELTTDLRHYLEDRELAIAPDLSHRKLVKWSRRNPMLAGAVYAASIMSLLFFLYRIFKILVF
jgi:serine/threonine-protein kinase